MPPQYSPHQIKNAFDFDLHDLSTDDIQFINSNYQYASENEFHKISNAINLYGVKVKYNGYSY